MHLYSEKSNVQNLLDITLPVIQKFSILTENAWICVGTDDFA